MKKILSALFAITALALAGGAEAITVSDYPAGTAANGIGGSRHNMGGLGRVITTTATTEICVFCHTPHHANSAVEPAPLWNRTNQTEFSYTPYGTTIAGNYVEEVGSVSLACLSCHDGVTTLDNIINAPGKGLGTGFGNDGGSIAINECSQVSLRCRNYSWETWPGSGVFVYRSSHGPAL